MTGKPRVRAYVDGFNLYKGALQGSPHKWLDLAALSDRLAGTRVDRVAYCTAPLVALPGDPGVVVRQQMYLRALSGNPRVDIYRGKFSQTKPRMHKVAEPGCRCCDGSAGRSQCGCCSGRTITVVKFEEKGSDVQLAVQLVKDAYLGLFDLALVISNDSDLQPAVDVVLGLPNKNVMVVNPRKKGQSLHGSSRNYLSGGLLASSQMPVTVIDGAGLSVTKPSTW
jgi:hypothetical protein